MCLCILTCPLLQRFDTGTQTPRGEAAAAATVVAPTVAWGTRSPEDAVAVGTAATPQYTRKGERVLTSRRRRRTPPRRADTQHGRQLPEFEMVGGVKVAVPAGHHNLTSRFPFVDPGGTVEQALEGYGDAGRFTDAWQPHPCAAPESLISVVCVCCHPEQLACPLLVSLVVHRPARVLSTHQT